MPLGLQNIAPSFQISWHLDATNMSFRQVSLPQTDQLVVAPTAQSNLALHTKSQYHAALSRIFCRLRKENHSQYLQHQRSSAQSTDMHPINTAHHIHSRSRQFHLLGLLDLPLLEYGSWKLISFSCLLAF